MAKWARKDENNNIVELIDFDPEGKFHPDIVWTSVPDNATVADSTSPVTLTVDPDPKGPELTEEELAARAEAEAAANAELGL
jgi:hypothetical protein